MREAAGEGPGSALTEEEFSTLTLKVLDGAATVEEIGLLERELCRSADGARRREYVALARLRGLLAEVLTIPENRALPAREVLSAPAGCR